MELIIAEKHSVAKAIGEALGIGNKKDGYYENHRYYLTWCVGHLVSLSTPDAYDPKYKRWDRNDLPIIPDEWKHQVTLRTEKQYKIVEKLMNKNDVDIIICATDSDREGELIFRRIYTMANCQKKVKRYWESSLEVESVLQGMQNLKDSSNYDGLYKASMCRAKADWLIGLNGTRLFTTLYGSGGSKPLSVGRVQTPTLALIVERDNQIKNFRAEKFYTNHIDCDGMDAVIRERVAEFEKVEAIRVETDGQDATVTSVEHAGKNINPPKLYDLTTLQREANQYFQYTASQTLEIMQELYEAKLATYPRTDSQYITDEMENTVKELIPLLREKLAFIENKNEPINTSKIINNKKVTGHHAILPTKSFANKDISELKPEQLNILNLISLKLLCATDIPHHYSETTIKLDCKGYEFTAKGKTIIENGWKRHEGNYRDTFKKSSATPKEEVVLPNVSKYDVFKAVKASIKEIFTTAPKHYTDATLLTAMETAGNEHITEDMEKKGIGTSGTRASFIEKLINSNYIARDKRYLISTPDGVTLISIVPEMIKSPKTTAEWEEQLFRIEKNQAVDVEFMKDIVALTRQFVRENGTATEGTTFTSDREILGTCPRCQGDIIEGKKNYYCENKECKFAIWKEDKFFKVKKKKVTTAMVKDFLVKGKTDVKKLYSPKKDTTYDATVLLVDTGEYVNFELSFDEKPKKKTRKASATR